jgi:hypothetical protein
MANIAAFPPRGVFKRGLNATFGRFRDATRHPGPMRRAGPLRLFFAPKISPEISFDYFFVFPEYFNSGADYLIWLALILSFLFTRIDLSRFYCPITP